METQLLSFLFGGLGMEELSHEEMEYLINDVELMIELAKDYETDLDYDEFPEVIFDGRP